MAACSTASSTAAAVPVVQLHVAVVAAPQQLVWPLQQLSVVLQEADTPVHGLHGQEGYIKVPVFQQQYRKENAVTKK